MIAERRPMSRVFRRIRSLTPPILAATCIGCGGGGGADPVAPPPVQQNHAPVIVSPLPSRVYGVVDHPFSFDTSQGGTTVVDPDGDPLTYDLTFGPRSWISVSGSKVSGTPAENGDLQISAYVTDGHGGSVNLTLNVTIKLNAVPSVARPIDPMLVVAGQQVNFDTTQGGTTFTDDDGDALQYDLTMLSPALGLIVDGTRVVGAMTGVGAVNFKLTARDGYGGQGEEVVAFGVAAPEPGKPMLPASSYVYDDAELDWPRDFYDARFNNSGVLFDRTPALNPATDAGATLGRVLFYDKRLSLTNTHACATCHVQAHGFASSQRVPTGVPGMPLTRNAMALANARYSYENRYFMDGRAPSLEALVLMPIEEPSELDHSVAQVVEKLAATDFYPALFAQTFGTTVDRQGISRALAQYVRSLVSYRSRFDAAFSVPRSGAYVDPATVLSPLELRGAELFGSPQSSGSAGCTSCHDTRIQSLPFPMNTGLDVVATDPGSGAGRFREASLRNIAVTGPYMHDGRFATLREVIDHYDHGVLDTPETSPRLRVSGNGGVPRKLNLTEEDKSAIEAFLLTLTDDAMLTDPRFSDPFN